MPSLVFNAQSTVRILSGRARLTRRKKKKKTTTRRRRALTFLDLGPVRRGGGRGAATGVGGGRGVEGGGQHRAGGTEHRFCCNTTTTTTMINNAPSVQLQDKSNRVWGVVGEGGQGNCFKHRFCSITHATKSIRQVKSIDVLCCFLKP